MTAGVLAYVYPGGTGTNLVEVYGTAQWTIATLTLAAGLNWAPGQANQPGSSRYLFGSAAWQVPRTPITLRAQLGAERGSAVLDATGATTAKRDWLLGADVAGSAFGLDNVTLSLGWSSNDLPDRTGRNSYAKGGAFLMLGAAF